MMQEELTAGVGAKHVGSLAGPPAGTAPPPARWYLGSLLQPILRLARLRRDGRQVRPGPVRP